MMGYRIRSRLTTSPLITTFPACSKLTVMRLPITDCTCPMPQLGCWGWRTRIPGANIEFISSSNTGHNMPDTLAELISSRICHDLISPVGAIGNGLELMEAMGSASPELELVGQSAHSAQAKLKYFRLAFGASSGGMIGGAEAARVAEEMFTSGRLSLEVAESWGTRERRLVKLLYLLLLCVESSLPRGGRMQLTPTESGWRITVEGVPVAPPADLWRYVVDGQNGIEVSAKTIQFSLARQSMVEQSIAISAAFSDTSLQLQF